MKAAINEDNLFAFIIKCSLALLSVLTAGGVFLYSGKVGISVLTGGIIAILNFIWMQNMLQRIIYNAPAAPARYAQLRLVIRLSITALVLSLAITSGYFSLAGLLAGLSIIVIIIIAITLYFFVISGG